LKDSLFGHIYSLCQGVERLFGITSQPILKSLSTSSSISSSIATSSSAAKKQSSSQPKPRPGVVQKVHQQIAEILIMVSSDDTLAGLQKEKDMYVILAPVIVLLEQSWKKLPMGLLNRQQIAINPRQIKRIGN
jgi:hypothetical protein